MVLMAVKHFYIYFISLIRHHLYLEPTLQSHSMGDRFRFSVRPVCCSRLELLFTDIFKDLRSEALPLFDYKLEVHMARRRTKVSYLMSECT